MAKTPKPTVEDILHLYDKCKGIYSGLGAVFDEDELLYNLEFAPYLNLPKEFEASGTVLPTASDMVDTCVDHTDVINARVFVNRKGTSNVSLEEAEMMRKFYLGLIHRTSVESTISPWRVAAKHFWLHGLGVLKTVWDADRYPDKPVQSQGQSDDSYAEEIDRWRAESYAQTCPIVIQAVHPRNIMPDPYDIGGRFIFEVQFKLVLDVKSRYPKWGNPLARTSDQLVECVSFWTPEYRCELYDGEPILKIPVARHNYGFLPYVLIDSGLGNVDSKGDPTKKYVGVLRKIASLLVSESRSYSISDIVLAKTAWPWGTIEGPGAEQVEKLDQTFGSYTALPKDTKVVNQSPQVPPQDLQTFLAVTSSYITSHAAPNSIRGLGEEGVRSGNDRQLLIGQASTRYLYASEAFRNGTAKVLANCARLQKNVIPGNVRVWAKTPTDEFDVTVDKNKMREPFTCYVEFAPTDEQDEYRRHDDLERLVSAKIVTPTWATTQMNNVDPEQMEIDRMVEQFKLDPMVQQVVSQYLAGKLMEGLTVRSRAESIKNPPPEIPMIPPTVGSAQPGQTQPGQSQPTGRVGLSNPEIPPIGSPSDLQNKLSGLRRPTAPNQQGTGGGGSR